MENPFVDNITSWQDRSPSLPKGRSAYMLENDTISCCFLPLFHRNLWQILTKHSFVVKVGLHSIHVPREIMALGPEVQELSKCLSNKGKPNKTKASIIKEVIPKFGKLQDRDR